MPIYSKNRTGSMALETAVVEGYTDTDFGRIMCEAQLNDMAFFEAILHSDFNELKGLQEGTILEAEVNEMNKKSLKSMVAGLKTRLQQFWAKIKAAFQSAVQKIAAYALKDGKAFVKEFNDVVGKTIKSVDKWSGSVDNVVVYDLGHNMLANYEGDALKTFANMYAEDKEISVADMIKMGLHDHEPKEYPKAAMEAAAKTVTLNKGNVSEFLDKVDNAKAYIKALQDTEKNAGKAVKAAIGSMDTLGDNEYGARLNQMIGAFESVVTTIARTGIAVTKADLKSRRKALSAALGQMRGEAKNVTESAIYEAACEVDFAMNYRFAVNESNQAAINALIASV